MFVGDIVNLTMPDETQKQFRVVGSTSSFSWPEGSWDNIQGVEI
jgi:hypothetical protein